MSYGQFNTFYRKIDGTVKSRYYANGSIKKKFVSKEEIVSYTATTQSTIITRVLEAKQNRDVMTLDIPNAVVQTEVHQENKKNNNGNKRSASYALLEKKSGLYDEFVVYQGKKKMLYVRML